jgi:hypothetical protein
MMAITTSNSTSVNPFRGDDDALNIDHQEKKKLSFDESIERPRFYYKQRTLQAKNVEKKEGRAAEFFV